MARQDTERVERPAGRHFADAVVDSPNAIAVADSEEGVEREELAASEDDGMDAEAVGKSAALMSGLVIISRITGFFRTWAQAYGLGASITASAFTVANGMPNALYELVMGGMLVTAFLPVYVSVKRRAGREGASAYASNLLSLVTLLMTGLAVLSFIFASEIIWTQSFNASAEFDRDLSVYFFRFFAISIVLYALSSVISSVLNAERDYFWSTAAPVVNNIITTASFFLYGFLVDRGMQDIAILTLAIGSPLGVLSQVAVQIPALRRHGVRLRFRIDLHDPCIRETLTIGIPTLIVTLVSFATTSVQSSCSLSVNPNGASITYYARIWYMLPYSVFAIPITTAMFTELSSFVASGNMKAYVKGIRDGSGKILFLLIPFAMYLMVFAPCLAGMLSSSRMTGESVSQLANYLVWLSISLPGYGVCTYLQKACSSLRKMYLFAIAECIAGAIQIVICLVFTPVYGFNVVGFSSTFFFVSIDLVTFFILRRELGSIGFRSIVVSGLRACALGGLGALVGAVILWALQTFVGPLSGGMLQSMLYAVAGGLPALLVTFGIAAKLRIPEASFLTAILARFIPSLAR
ncbi:murein biosynthesis integral membrane protein MurJ [Collinsella sp. BA40]|uniref:murein biosynthesis integral membrane protein MurJ n=1 Tax=Collinsella sp. BA40 TaxID=2560852 RepID=UPI0011CC25E5|nr:murein biosynthesis integral membrane protein MurJ [Collinsella sp. BA40]TXF34913.1 murein biosynthesis integral membrane protein MurJ [Collinsella sp. BA40]